MKTRAASLAILGPLLAAACGLGVTGTGAGTQDGDADVPDASAPPGPCTPSEKTACACPGGGNGTATCNREGTAASACTGCPADRAEAGAAGLHDASPDSPHEGADAAPDVAVSACSGCMAETCPTQSAACAAGSDCLAFVDCSAACSNDDDGGCSQACENMHPVGEDDFAALTLCSLACGAGCLATLAAGSPGDDGGGE